ncbi:hypothetical protein AWB79_06483 [Caballeronia hypogeia]|uniref:Lipoprotein n=1 Tax=Caballeronia hypogeia TaxID=1777140 RepID=A0A158D6N1_9BURK|nr:hypothetical protein [Caballeronia hypogeia]SAK89876.1 hypothetical protein AWB79_06483 [Caballeronia hypogeia]
MQVQLRSSPLRAALVAALLLSPALSASAEDLPDVCSALKAIVAAPSFHALAKERAPLPAGSPGQGTCRGSAHSYDCRWRAHWGADGVVADPLQELGADIAACFPDVRHDVNTATRQHFALRSASDKRVTSMTATIEAPNTMRLRIVR